MTDSRFRPARRWLIFWTIFVGLGAVAGAFAMIIDPSGKLPGMDGLLPYLQALPLADVLFRDLLFSGVALLLVNGVTNLTAAALLIMKKRIGLILGTAFGATLMLWTVIQLVILPLNIASVAYCLIGFLQAVTGLSALIYEKQERFTFREEDYPHIGENPKELVVYCSRMGYTKKVAYEKANETGASVFELVPLQRVKGTAGFWRCGKSALHRWTMPIQPVFVNLMEYDRVTLCTPIWVFTMASPVRYFCNISFKKIRSVDYVLVHYTGGRYARVVKQMDALLGITHRNIENIQCRMGTMKRIEEKNEAPAEQTIG